MSQTDLVERTRQNVYFLTPGPRPHSLGFPLRLASVARVRESRTPVTDRVYTQESYDKTFTEQLVLWSNNVLTRDPSRVVRTQSQMGIGPALRVERVEDPNTDSSRRPGQRSRILPISTGQSTDDPPSTLVPSQVLPLTRTTRSNPRLRPDVDRLSIPDFGSPTTHS